MDYKKHYDKLIYRAKRRILVEYKETHHIIPKCIGGTNDVENLVILSPEEHFVAHQLLVKMHPNNKRILWALNAFTRTNYKCVRNNKMYGWIRRKYAASVTGENNHMAKIQNKDVLDIYFSEESPKTLAKKYNVGTGQIQEIKRKVSFRNITKDIVELPGYCKENKKTRRCIPIDLVPRIFYDSGNYAYFWEKYGASRNVVLSIKTKKTYRKITAKLPGEPGQICRYGLSNDDLEYIHSSNKNKHELADEYNICHHTITNIMSGRTRGIFSDI